MNKGIMVLVNLLAIPITIRYLGAESFGIWTTITTALTMLLVLDLGIANSLTNFISEAYARNDHEHASRYTTTALAVMTCIAGLLGIVGWFLWPHMHWDALFHVSSAIQPGTVSRAVAAAFIIFLIDLPSRLAVKVLGGYQELRTANIFAIVGSILNLAGIVLMVKLRAGLTAMVACTTGALVGADLLCLLWLINVHKPWLRPRIAHLDRSAARRMMQMGTEFFILQIAGLVVFNSDNLVIAHYLGPAEVAPYSVAWRLVGYAAMVQSLLIPALWPAFSEAFERGDMAWVRQTFRRTMWITMGTAFGFSVLFALAGRWIIRVWATNAAVPSQTLMLMMCVWVIISTLMNNTAVVLFAKGETRLQAWLGLFAAALNLALSILAVQHIGSVGVILGTILSYLAVLVVPQSILAWKVLRS
ncbi:MAG TPA: oligosaccharide flippase family protein [Alloacidobacterium sp.]|nr:oligosaccharide flippase family protein [Alloacidobacterium sp.]